MASAKDKMHQYLLDHVGEDVSRETLRDLRSFETETVLPLF